MATEPSIDQMKSELTKKGKADKPLYYQPAPPLSKADITAEADRIARQLSGQDNPQGMTQQQMARNAGLDVDIRGKKKAKINPIDFEQFKGSYSVGVPGDPSRGGLVPSKPTKGIKEPKAGEYLYGIGGEQLDRPVPLYGGKDYGAYGGPAGWASDLGASSGMFNVVKKLAKDNPESKILGHYHKMSPESLNHAMHMMDTVLTYHRPHEAPPEQIETLNHLMRNVKTTTAKSDVPYPEFPGFEKPAEVMLHGAMNSGMRKKLIGLLGTQKYFPGGKQKVEDIVHAISHPELRNLETGAGGHAILKFDPSKELRDTISSHPTYGHDIPSELLGKTKYPTPFKILAPRSHHNAVTEIAAMGKKVNPFNQAKMNIIREPIDEQYINQMGEYEQMMRKLLGYAEGGNVKAEHIQKLMAMRPYFEEQAKRKQAYNDYAKKVYPQHQKTYSEWAKEQGYHNGPSQDEMLAHVMLHKADGGAIDLANVGVEEAPDMSTKSYINPGPQSGDQLPVGGVDMIPTAPGQQLMPSPSPGGMPQPAGQPPGMQIPQDGPQNPLAQLGAPKGTQPMGMPPMGMPAPPQGGLPQGVKPQGPQPTSMSNLLNLTPQGQAMSAMKPPMPRMAGGGTVAPTVDYSHSRFFDPKNPFGIGKALEVKYPKSPISNMALYGGRYASELEDPERAKLLTQDVGNVAANTGVNSIYKPHDLDLLYQGDMSNPDYQKNYASVYSNGNSYFVPDFLEVDPSAYYYATERGKSKEDASAEYERLGNAQRLANRAVTSSPYSKIYADNGTADQESFLREFLQKKEDPNYGMPNPLNQGQGRDAAMKGLYNDYGGELAAFDVGRGDLTNDQGQALQMALEQQKSIDSFNANKILQQNALKRYQDQLAGLTVQNGNTQSYDQNKQWLQGMVDNYTRDLGITDKNLGKFQSNIDPYLQTISGIQNRDKLSSADVLKNWFPQQVAAQPAPEDTAPKLVAPMAQGGSAEPSIAHMIHAINMKHRGSAI